MPQKGLFLENRSKIVNKKSRDGQKWLFGPLKSQNFEKVYKIKIKKHAIVHLLQ